MRLQELADGRNRGVVELKADGGRMDALAGGERFQSLLHTAGIRADEATRAELDPAEVAGDDDGNVADAAVEEGGQHGAARGAVGLAVVAHSDGGGAPRRSDDVRPAVVRRVGKLFAHGGDE